MRAIKRLRVNRKRGVTATLMQSENKISGAPNAEEIDAMRDCAFRSVLLQMVPCRAQVASMSVKNFYQNIGYCLFRFIRKGDEEHSLSLNSQTVQRIEQYLAKFGHDSRGTSPLPSDQTKNWLG